MQIYLKILKLSSNPNAQAFNFNALADALKSLEMGTTLCEKVYRHLAAILHLGNIRFKNNDDGYAEFFEGNSTLSLELAAELLEIEGKQLKDALLKKKFGYPANRTNDKDIL